MLGYNEGIKLGLSGGEINGIKLGGDKVLELGSSESSFDGSNDVKLEGLLLGDSMGSEVGTQLGPFVGTIDRNEDVTH